MKFWLLAAALMAGCSVPFNGLSGNPKQPWLSNRAKATILAGAGLGTMTPGLTLMANNNNHRLNDSDNHEAMLGGMMVGAGAGALTGAGTQYALWNYEPGSDRVKCAIAGWWAGAGMAELGSVGLITLNHARPATACGADPTDANCNYHQQIWQASIGSLIGGGAIGAVTGYFWCSEKELVRQ